MIISKNKIDLINERLEYLYSNFNIEPSTDDIEIGDEDIFIGYPEDRKSVV